MADKILITVLIRLNPQRARQTKLYNLNREKFSMCSKNDVFIIQLKNPIFKNQTQSYTN